MKSVPERRGGEERQNGQSAYLKCGSAHVEREGGRHIDPGKGNVAGEFSQEDQNDHR